MSIDNPKPELFWEGKTLKGLVGGASSPFFKDAAQNLFFQSPHNVDLHKIENGEVHPYVQLDFEKRKNSVNFLDENDWADIRPIDRMKHPLPRVICAKEWNEQLLFIYSYALLFRACICDLNNGTSKNGILRGYPGVGNPISCWKEYLISSEYPFDIDLEQYQSSDYSVRYQHEYPGSDNPVIVECKLK